MVHMKKLRDQNGRLRRVAFEGTESVLYVDQVIPAIGQKIDPTGMERLLGVDPFFRVDEWGALAGVSGIHAGGDARGGDGSVSRAIGDGRRAAAAITARLRDGVPSPSTQVDPIPFSSLNPNYFEPGVRAREPVLPVEERIMGYQEIEGPLSTAQAIGEGRRCFSCGNCFACDNCWTLCPDMSVLKTREEACDGSHYVFDYMYCKGCGVCANECPCGYIVMEDEPL
jgi:Pyruvate/2-oxoacid:ferredoxin oxidoreductase delta subunit